MTRHITAEFSDQQAAASAVDKLLSRGVARGQVATRFDESRGDTPVAAGTPTTVVPGASREGRGIDKPDGPIARYRAPQYGTVPARFGQTCVTVTTDDDAQARDIRDCLAAAGGNLHDTTDEHGATDEPQANRDSQASSAVIPDDDAKRADDDTQRAIDASRGGASLC